MTRLLQEANDGLLIKPSPQTFGDFMEEWFREYAVHQCSGKTVERYRQLADYVLPKLGATPLHELTSLVLERLYNSLRTAGGRRGELKANGQREPSPLSAKTVRHIAGLIQVALNSAVRWKLIKVNPAIACQLPKMEIKEAVALDQQQTEWFLDASRGHWMYPILMLAVATGCR
ncbi:MAG TPA: hypothetical protein VM120_07205, partial [Bryobacteraceae bacterium]|nr:hypothetical protein [Bryobacteraceae bacterium]